LICPEDWGGKETRDEQKTPPQSLSGVQGQGGTGWTLMAKMGIQALYRKPNTSKKHPGHAVYPYLLRGKKIERGNEVWAMDITYIPMARGWVYLPAVVDWASRRVLAHRISISMDTGFCLDALEEACVCTAWLAGDLQNRPGQPVHQHGLHRCDQEPGCRHRRASRYLSPESCSY